MELDVQEGLRSDHVSCPKTTAAAVKYSCPLSVSQIMKLLTVIVGFAMLVAGCSTGSMLAPANVSRFPVDGHSELELSTYFKFMPSLSGYYLPAGVYSVEKEYSDGVLFRAPKGAKSLSLAGATDATGGIFLPKSGTQGARGYAYIILPGLGRSPYFLPDDFFAQYEKKWRILNPANKAMEDNH